MDAPTFLVLVLLGPVAAVYDFVTNPQAPPHIFVAQVQQGFGLQQPKSVYVTRP